MAGKAKYFQGLIWTALALPMAAEAHPWHWAGESIGFLNGLIHPIISRDHILTMLAVGLWMPRVGGRAIYMLPFVFVALMLIGGGMTLVPIEIAHAEDGMNLSVLILALMLILGNRISKSMGAATVGIMAVFHGYVHADDLLVDVGAIDYIVGFAVATMALAMTGMAAAALFNRLLDKCSPGRLATHLAARFALQLHYSRR